MRNGPIAHDRGNLRTAAPMHKNPKIAVVLPDFKPWGITPFFNGVSEHARANKWLLTACPINPQGDDAFPRNWSRLRSWSVDGLILLTNSPEKLALFRQLEVPLVYISESLGGGAGVPGLMTDHRRVARLAAEHLLGLGLKNLAFHGIRNRSYSTERLREFKRAGKEAGIEVNSFCLPSTIRDALWNERYEPVKRWLGTLPLPVGIMAVSDYRGLIVLSACQELGLRVPDEVAVIGVDNDLMICEFSVPTLTSVCLNPYRMGLEAARLLEKLMRGAPPREEPLLVEPTGVVARGSTDILHVRDPIVRRAVLWMQKRYAASFTMDAVASELGVSRRFLEKHFREERDVSPADFLLQLRIGKAKLLLASPVRKSIEEIARLTGFVTGKNLRAAFRRVLDASPNDFRPRGCTADPG